MISHDLKEETSKTRPNGAADVPVYGFTREVAGRNCYFCYDSADHLAVPNRSKVVIAHATEKLDRRNFRETLFVVTQQLILEKFLPENSELFNAAKNALEAAHRGDTTAPLVFDGRGWTYHLAVELHPEQNAVLFRRAHRSELVKNVEPLPDYVPLSGLNDHIPAPLPVGGLTKGPDGYNYDSLGIFPRFTRGDCKLAVAFRPPIRDDSSS